MVETISLLNEDYGLGIEVYALVRSETRAKNRFSHFLDKSWFNIIVQDVSDEIKIDASINYIIHAASQASPLYYKTDPVGTLLANTKGLITFLSLQERI